jgi:hypothetical protein
MSATESFFLGLGIGIVGTVVSAVFVFRNNKRKIAATISILADRSLNAEQKIAKIREIWKI